MEAVSGLGQVGEDEQALTSIEKALADPDANVRREAVFALDRLGGDKSLALLGKALDDKDKQVRRVAAGATGRIGGNTAVTLLETAIADQDTRLSAVVALGDIGGDKARDMLLARLPMEQDRNVLSCITHTLRLRFPNDPAVEKALADPAIKAKLGND